MVGKREATTNLRESLVKFIDKACPQSSKREKDRLASFLMKSILVWGRYKTASARKAYIDEMIEKGESMFSRGTGIGLVSKRDFDFERHLDKVKTPEGPRPKSLILRG